MRGGPSVAPELVLGIYGSLATQGGPHTSWSRWDAQSLDPGRVIWSGLHSVSEGHEQWHWQDPARHSIPAIRRTALWLPRHTGYRRHRDVHVSTINYSDSIRSKRASPLEGQWASYLDGSLLY